MPPLKSPSLRPWIRILALLGGLVLAACASGPKTPVATLDMSSLDKAWALLWANDYPAAAEAFKALQKDNPADPRIRQGTALAALALGDRQQAYKTALKGLAEGENSPQAGALFSFALDAAPDGKETLAALLEAAQALGKSGALDDVKRRATTFVIDYYHTLAPDLSKEGEAVKKLGLPAAWKILGPLANLSNAAFGAAQLKETDPDIYLSATVLGANGQRLRWCDPDKLSPDGFLSPDAYLGWIGGGALYYAYAVLEVEATATYIPRLERSGATALWIDGKPIMADAGERRQGEFRAAPLELAKGSHKILVKLGGSRWTPGFRLSLEATKAAPDQRAKALGYALASLDQVAEGDKNEALGTLAMAALSSGRLEDLFWLAWGLYDYGYDQAALAVIAKARGQGAATSSLFDLVEYRCLRSQGRRIDARTALLSHFSEDSPMAPALDYLILEGIDQSRYQEARRLLDGPAKRLGSWQAGAYDEVYLALARGSKVFDAVDAYRKGYPDSPDVDLLLADKGLAYFSLGDLLTAMTGKGMAGQASSLTVNYLVNNERWAEALPLLETRVGLFPDSPGLRVWLVKANYFAGKSDAESSLAKLEALRETFPSSLNLADLGVALAENRVIAFQRLVGKGTSQSSSSGPSPTESLAKAKATLATWLTRAIALDPTNYDYRKQYRICQERGDLDLYALQTEIGKAIKEYEAARKGSGPKAEDAEYVLQERLEYFFGDGASRYYDLAIVKILSKEGVNSFSSQDLRVGSDPEVTQAFIIKPNGAMAQARIGGTRVSFPGLDVGDYLVLRYGTSFWRLGSLAKAYWDDLMIQSLYPIYKSRTTFVYPNEGEPSLVMHNADGLGLTTKKSVFEAGYTAATITGEGLPGLAVGRFLPGWQDSLAWVDISSLGSWQAVADWYRSLYLGRARPNEVVRAKARELTKGCATRDETIARLYDFAANDIAYEDLAFQYSAFVPQSADSVLQDGFGDCKDKSCLLVALLDAAGIKSHMALAMAGYKGENFYLPSNRFNHAIVVVPDPRGDLVLDPTADYLTWPETPQSLEGIWYLPVKPEGEASAIGRVGAAKPDRETTSLFLHLDVTKDGVKASGSATLRGTRARQLRASQESARADLKLTQGGDLMAAFFPGIQIDSWSSRGLSGRAAGVEPGLDFTGSLGLLQSKPSQLCLNLSWATDLPKRLRVFAPTDKEAVVVEEGAFATPLKETIVVNPSPGAAITDKPQGALLRFKEAYASFTYSMVGSKLVCEREIYLPRLVISVQDRKAFQDFLAAIDAKAKEGSLITIIGGTR